MTTLYLSPARFPEGSRLRSYDFPGNITCYQEGVLVKYESLNGSLRYVIDPDKAVFNGRTTRKNLCYIYPPVNGTPSFRGCTKGVERIK